MYARSYLRRSAVWILALTLAACRDLASTPQQEATAVAISSPEPSVTTLGSGEGPLDAGRYRLDLAQALVDVPLRNAAEPSDVTLDGYSGKYLEWSVPADIDFEDCDEGFFESWTATGWASDRYQQAPGQVDQLWILDINGSRLVIDAFSMPYATAEEGAEI